MQARATPPTHTVAAKKRTAQAHTGANIARKTGRDKSDYVREAVAEHLDDLEDLQLAEERFRELQEGKSGTISLAEMMKIHGMEN